MLKNLTKEFFFITLLVAIFLFFSFLISKATTREVFDPAIYFHFSSLFIRGAVGFLAIIFLWQIFLNFNRGFAGLFCSVKTLRTKYLKTDQILGFLILMVLIPVYFSCYTAFKAFTNYTKPFSFDIVFKEMDQFLHFGTHPWIFLHSFFANENVIIIIDWIYSKGWFVAWGPVFVWMALTPEKNVRWVFFANFMLSWLILGTFMANLLPAAGPCYFDKISGTLGPYQGLFEHLDQVNNRFNLDAINLQKMLWKIYLGDDLLIGTGISAMPSMHISMLTTCTLGAWSLNRNIGLLYFFLTLVFLAVSVYLGWHYAVDGYASIVLTCAIWFVCLKLSPYREKSSTPG